MGKREQNTPPSDKSKLLTRRKILIFMATGGIGTSLGVGVYGFCEARWLSVNRQRVPLKRLPDAFAGLKVALLSDIHHCATVPLTLLNKAVSLVNAEKPDVVLLGGDYVTGSSRFFDPCMKALSNLKAPLGVYGILGNHDCWAGASEASAAMKRHHIVELTNQGVWLRRKEARLRLAGVGDLWNQKQDLTVALGDMAATEGAIVISHNPDYAEKLSSPKVDLLVSGHTHGGQVVAPFFGPPFIPSDYGNKYKEGLIQGPNCSVYVTRGVGTFGPPFRFFCRPEVCLLELVQ